LSCDRLRALEEDDRNDDEEASPIHL